MAGFHGTFQILKKEQVITQKQYGYPIFFRMELTFLWIMPFGDELLALDICVSFDLSSVMCFVVTNRSGFVVIFKKTFVLKLYNELRHLRITRD